MIQATEVTREYRGGVRALDGVSLDAPPGTALGVVGPNGAGKSTLLRLLLGYLRPTAGTVTVGGLAPRAYVERHGIAHVPESATLPPHWTVRGALEAFAALGEVPDHPARIDAALERLGLESVAKRHVGTLSKGTVQRLALAQAVLGDRRVMVLDEPETGLDPEWIYRLRGIVADWRRADPERVLVMASHDLDEVERMTDRVAVLEGGRLREVIDLRGAAQGLPAYRLEVEPAPGAAEAVKAAFPGAVAASGAALAYRLRPADLGELSRGAAELLARGAVLRALVPERPSLEDRFRRGKEGGR